MACPFFYPLEPLPDAARGSRVPLGVLCRGMCQAGAGPAVEPDEDIQSTWCNMGYGRGICSRFPQDARAPDAVRFSAYQEPEGGLRIAFVLEKEYGPLSHGVLHYRSGQIDGDAPDARIARQAEVFAFECERRRAQA